MAESKENEDEQLMNTKKANITVYARIKRSRNDAAAADEGRSLGSVDPRKEGQEI